MPRRQPKAAIERRERELLRHYARVWQRVEQLQESIADDPARWRQRAKLTEARHAIERELDDLDARAKAWFSNEFPAIHAMGVNAGAAELAAPTALVWSTINPDSVAILAAEGFGDLLKSTRTVRRTTKAMIRSVLEDEIMDKLIRGDTAEAAARRARRLIERRGVYSVRYKDGSVHGLREYANMAVRTKTAVAYNLGALDAQTSQGIQHWEIMDGVGCVWPTGHGAGIPAQGQVVTRDDALMYPIAHPNCRRAFAARPDLDPAPYLREIQTPDVRVPTEELRERARKRTEERVNKRARQ